MWMFMFDAQGNVCWLQIGTGVFICLAMFMLMFCTTWPTDVFWWVIMSLYKPPEDSRVPIYRWVINLTKWQSVEATRRLFWVVRIPMTKLEHDLPRFHQLAGTTIKARHSKKCRARIIQHVLAWQQTTAEMRKVPYVSRMFGASLGKSFRLTRLR